MVSHLFFYQLVLVALVWLCVMLHWAWPSDPATCPPTPEPTPPLPKRHREPPPFAGLTTKPHCDACAATQCPSPTDPLSPATPHRATRGRRRQVDTSTPFLPEPGLCLSGLGRLGQSPRQWPSQWWSLAAAAVCRLSRLFSRDPRHALAWQARLCRPHRARHRVPGRGAGHPGHGAGVRGGPQHRAAVVGRSGRAAAAFSRHVLHDVRVTQVQLDELFALLSAVKDGAVSEAEAIERLERSPQWVWVAMDPESKLLLAIDVGDRTLAMAQRLVHHVAQVLAPDCAPLFLTDGFREWLLLDSRVVDVPMAYNPTFVILSSLKPLFFNSLKNELRFSDNAGA